MNPDGKHLPLLHIARKEAANRGKRSGGPSSFHRPPPDQQSERLAPRFQRLVDAHENRRLELREELAGVEPEMALVLETIGSVQDFVNAVQRVDGFEWLGELDAEFEPDLDFFDPKHNDEPLPGSLYLVMTDHKALDELLSLWKRWKRAPDESFGHGWNRFREVFCQLRDIRPWGPQDRLRETCLAEVWEERLEAGEERVRSEIELWFRKSTARRVQAEQILERYVAKVGGQVLGQSTIPEIAYHGVLAELPAAAAQGLLNLDLDIDLVRFDDIMFFRPVGQMGSPDPEDEPGPDKPPPADPPDPVEPTIALFDGLPLERHQHLEGRLIVDDPDGWAITIPASRRHHGTAMASLILHGDLSSDEKPLDRPIYVRPVLKPVSWDGSLAETIPEDALAVDLLHRAVRRLFVDEEGGPGVAPSVQIVNVSIGDRSRPFYNLVSPFARLLDWLAWQHRLLIVVSAGNHPEDVQLESAVGGLRAEALQTELWTAIRRRAHLQRLLAPAESLNALAIGAEHRDGSSGAQHHLHFDAAATDPGETIPSPITGWGPGIGRAVKPDIFLPGGRQLFAEHSGRRLRPRIATGVPPGQQVAASGQPGDLRRTRYTVGTSNAAAIASRTAGQILDQLPEVIEGFDGELDRKFLAPILKAFLVHGASWGGAKELFMKLFDTTARKDVGRFLGFGFADVERVLRCTEQRVTLVTWGELTKDTGDIYMIPLPYGLSGVMGSRRLVTTLAWLSPTNPLDRRYRQSDLWVEIRQAEGKKIGVSRGDVDYNAAMRGTVHHEVWEGRKASVFAETDEIELKVSCREHARGLRTTDLIPYALLVTLEVAPELDIQVYEEVRARVVPRVKVGG